MDWYEKQSAVESRNVGSLAVICRYSNAWACEKLLIDIFLRIRKPKFSYGTTLSMLMAARFYGPKALVNVGQWCEDSGAEFFFGMPPEKANDDRESGELSMPSSSNAIRS